MQYPIIDNLIYAYLRNGWTGLELTGGKNLVDISRFANEYPQFCTYDENENVLNINNVGGALYTSGISVNIDTKDDCIASFYIKTGTATSVSVRFIYSDGTLIQTSAVTSADYIFAQRPFARNKTITSIRFNWSNGGDFYIKNFMIEYGDTPTEYEPYSPSTTDIEHRLKLPLPHYFPHPVIDALQRAAAGTQTADDTEVLRHYLTPLGIGGI